MLLNYQKAPNTCLNQLDTSQGHQCQSQIQSQGQINTIEEKMVMMVERKYHNISLKGK